MNTEKISEQEILEEATDSVAADKLEWAILTNSPSA